MNGLVRRGETGYDSARHGLSASAWVPPERPAAVFGCGSAADVVRALAVARREGWQVTVRSGGHGLSFGALRDGVLALDLAALAGVEVCGNSAVVGPGATSLGVARALQASGRAFPVGHQAGVGLGGFVMAGGNGWNQGRWGPAVESVLAADVVLADGRAVRLGPDRDPAAFELLRGGGPGFPGIVTAWHVELQSAPAIHRRAHVFVAADVVAAARWADRLRASVAPDVELTVHLTPRPFGPLPAEPGPVVTVSTTAFGADPAHARALLPISPSPRALAAETGARRSIAVAEGPTDLASLMTAYPLPPVGQVSQQAWCTGSYGDLLPPLAEQVVLATSPLSSALVSSSSHRRCAPPSPSHPHVYRQPSTMTVAAYGVWEPREPGPGVGSHRHYVETALASVREHWVGHYVGETDLRATPERLAGCFGAGVLERLAALRDRLDPERLFAGADVP